MGINMNLSAKSQKYTDLDVESDSLHWLEAE
jgi:hypothetical protein